MAKTKNWVFTIHTSGYGDTPEEAWADAVDNIAGNWTEFSNVSELPDYERREDCDEVGDDEEDDDTAGDGEESEEDGQS